MPWFSGLAILLELVETSGLWPRGLLDAYIAMIPKADGDSTPLGQRPLSVLPVVYRLWASLRLGHLREWVEGWLGLAIKSCPPRLSRVSRALHAASVARHHLATLPGLLHPQPRPPRLPALQRLRPTPMMTGTLFSMHMASPRHPVALRPPSPSRPTPLELVGAPATSAAAVCARPPSALCGGRSDVLSPVLCALSAGVASSCGFVCFSVGAGLLFRWRREADFGGLLRFLPPVLCGARLSLRVGSVLWGMSTAPLVFDVLLGDATLAYTCGALLPWRILSTLSRILSTRSPTL